MSNPFRNAMAYLGLVEEGAEYESAPVAPIQQSAPQQSNRAQVTPIRRAQNRVAVQSEMNEILTVHPKQYSDARVVAENFREGIPVIINLSQMGEADARRLIDFASGLSQGLYGKIERVTSKVFLLSPAHIAVSGDSNEEVLDDAAFFDQH
ncbi:MAG: cell division protein SepF [Microbacteriaceae bacterium]